MKGFVSFPLLKQRLLLAVKFIKRIHVKTIQNKRAFTLSLGLISGFYVTHFQNFCAHLKKA